MTCVFVCLFIYLFTDLCPYPEHSSCHSFLFQKPGVTDAQLAFVFGSHGDRAKAL